MVRVIRRLEELIRELATAAKTIGNEELASKLGILGMIQLDLAEDTTHIHKTADSKSVFWNNYSGLIIDDHCTKIVTYCDYFILLLDPNGGVKIHRYMKIPGSQSFCHLDAFRTTMPGDVSQK